LNLPLQRQVEDRTMPERTRTVAQLLGYADDARLLIINADDFGMCARAATSLASVLIATC
jgi:hypothetical protein